MALKLKTKSLSGMAKQYARMARGADKPDFKEPLRAGAKLVSANSIRRFDKEVDPNGKRWKKLSKSYEKRKLKKYNGKRSKLNVDTSLLRTSITSNSAALSKYDLSNTKVVFGTVVEYAKYVQGQRAFIGMDKKDIKEVGELFDIWLEKLYIENGRR